MSRLKELQQEMAQTPNLGRHARNFYMSAGYAEHFDAPNPIARAHAVSSLFTGHRKNIYKNDLIAGSTKGLYAEGITDGAAGRADRIVSSYGSRHFGTNCDHYAPDYETVLSAGIGGLLEKINLSRNSHKGEEKKLVLLDAMEISLRGFSEMIRQYAALARSLAQSEGDTEQRARYADIAQACEGITMDAPSSFRQALQLVWLLHISFVYEGRYAMALGRLDQYLYPFYKADIESGALTRQDALELMSCTLCKIGEYGDIVNIAIGGVKRDGTDAVNELSYVILEAVWDCNIPGPNLSARLHKGISDDFIDSCLKVIGTGLGYPALMNDEVNIPALHKCGYSLEDCRDYCMVGCIENFIPGSQPPWSDGRFNVPKYIELALNDGVCLLTGDRIGLRTGDVSELDTMDKFIHAFEEQLVQGAAEYVAMFNNENDRYNAWNYTQPYLSCFCRDCIGRGLDINDGGALYPSVHGAACMGIATVADSLAAVEKLVYNEKSMTLQQLRDALAADFVGYEIQRSELLSAPKYGNNDDSVDKYAVWYVDFLYRVFDKYRTRDGGRFYTLIASNVSNIYAGDEVAATPDGRGARQPESDAASPMRGMDRHGPTGVINSVTKPDYTLVAGGTVLNQKLSPSMFTDEGKRVRLVALIRAYIIKGGQELQINSVSRDVLLDAYDNPQMYSDLVVRVSGFSAYYIQLDKRVQRDILERTEQG
ncbi:MAG: pyruvate formate lyase family protein [Eubacteriales bacterium]